MGGRTVASDKLEALRVLSRRPTVRRRLKADIVVPLSSPERHFLNDDGDRRNDGGETSSSSDHLTAHGTVATSQSFTTISKL
jgi:hypothetical protein